MTFRSQIYMVISLLSLGGSAHCDGVREIGSMQAQSPYVTHAPLAFFSLGSLAVGGLVYALQNDLSNHGINNSARTISNEDISSIHSALGISGLTALISAGAYFYYSNRDYQRNSEFSPSISGNFDSEGKLLIKAKVSFPLGFFIN